MPKKKSEARREAVTEQPPREMPIVSTIETNFMPYAMSCIVSRALPEIDGSKPSQRKLLYTMYKMGLLTGARTKSANVVGATMKLNPHGDAAIYETLVRLSRGCEALLLPFVDSKGNFGKVYSRDMAYAAARYTEVKLEPICSEIFGGIDADAVEFTPNYDNTQTEPTLLPTAFPNILVSANLGIAVGMANKVCGFNLSEICKTTVALIKNPKHDVLSTIQGPDFPTGGEFIYERAALEEVCRTGRGSLRVRAVWSFDKKANCIEITEIPYTTTVEAIIEKVADGMKSGAIKDISDMRDETGKEGLKLAIDLKRGADPDKVMARLMRTTTLTDAYACNFNILIAGTPRVLGVRDILLEWISWREECVRRTVYHRLTGMRSRLHLLEGLAKILLDIDKAIAIIRGTEEDAEVIPNLMLGFGIDEEQAEFIAEIKLRNINKQYILTRTNETDKLRADIADAEELVSSRPRLRSVIVKELNDIDKKYGVPRKTKVVLAEAEEEQADDEPAAQSYPVRCLLTRDGYFKKYVPSPKDTEQKLKDGDAVVLDFEGSNADELLFFTDRYQVYKSRAADFPDGKAGVLGLYLPTKLDMEPGENVVWLAAAPEGDFPGSLLFCFADGRAARIELQSYATKTNRKKLGKAYSNHAPLVAAFRLSGESEIFMESDAGRGLLVSTAAIAPKPTRDSQGQKVMTLKAGQKLASAAVWSPEVVENRSRFKTKTIPAAGAAIRAEDKQKKLL